METRRSEDCGRVVLVRFRVAFVVWLSGSLSVLLSKSGLNVRRSDIAESFVIAKAYCPC